MAYKPLGATHVAELTMINGKVYYRFDGHVWKWWNPARSEWMRCVDNKPEHSPVPLPPSEQSQCCGTTCDKRSVADYIAKLEAVAEAARMVAHTITGDKLRQALGELPHD